MRLRRMMSMSVKLSLLAIVIASVLSWTPNAQAAATTFLPWGSWYPVNRGQTEGVSNPTTNTYSGQRVLNHWSNPYLASNGVKYFIGQSSWNAPGAPRYYPTQFQGRTVDYFWLWGCNEISVDPKCSDPNGGNEYISEGTAYGDNTYLELWGRGPSNAWEVYYYVDAFGPSGCTNANINQNVTQAQLRDTTKKSPLIFRLPASDVPGSNDYTSPPQCAVVSTNTFHAPGFPVLSGWSQTGRVFVTVRTIYRGIDGTGTPRIVVRNEYYNDNPNAQVSFDQWCGTSQFSEVCELVNGVWRGKQKTSGGVTARMVAYEDYWMTQVPQNDRMRDGMIQFHWFTWPAGAVAKDLPDNGTVPGVRWSLDTCTMTNGTISCQ